MYLDVYGKWRFQARCYGSSTGFLAWEIGEVLAAWALIATGRNRPVQGYV